jgi:hypothetical protein
MTSWAILSRKVIDRTQRVKPGAASFLVGLTVAAARTAPHAKTAIAERKSCINSNVSVARALRALRTTGGVRDLKVVKRLVSFFVASIRTYIVR